MTDIEVDRSAGIASLVFEFSDAELNEVCVARRSQKNLLLDEARIEQKRREQRRQVFGNLGILNDPAWDILLELYVAHATGNQLYASAVGAEAGIPQSTALRWLTVLEKEGLLRRRFDVFDKRRQWVGLTPLARSMMDQNLAKASTRGAQVA